MGYPNTIDRFNEKLNKNPSGGSYVVEERLLITNGLFDGQLRHDNINSTTIRVYTGSRFTGEEVRNFTLSIPDATPWRKVIRVYTNALEVFVTYETPGDTVEAEDINILQASMTATQVELERYKADGLIDGGSFEREV